MEQKRETKANKLCVREILSLSFVCGAYFFEFRGRNLVCFGIAYNFERMRTAFFKRVAAVSSCANQQRDNCTMASFYYSYQNPSFCCFLIQIRASGID